MDELYHDACLVDVYDVINASRDDFDFYRNELPPSPSSVLDIGCGTGTFALELAKLGYAVTGIDPALQMISKAIEKDVGNTVNWVLGSVLDLPTDHKFDVALMTGHGFQCLLKNDEIATFFEAVQKRLTPGGEFWFETRNPAMKPWLNWTPEHSHPPYSLRDGRTVKVVHEIVEMGDGLVSFIEQYEFSDQPDVLHSKSTLRFLELDDIKDLAFTSDLIVAEVFGNWSKEPFTTDSPEIFLRMTNSAG